MTKAAFFFIFICTLLCVGEASAQRGRQSECVNYDLTIDPKLDTNKIYKLSRFRFVGCSKRKANKARAYMDLARDKDLQLNRAFYDELIADVCASNKYNLLEIKVYYDSAFDPLDCALLSFKFDQKRHNR